MRWMQFFVSTVLAVAAADLYYRFGTLSIAAAGLAVLLFNILFTILVERLVLGFRSLKPRFVSIYDPYFWFHERLWKLLATPAFNGTPFKNVLWRMLGVQIGRRVFDDGCSMPEKTLVTIGDDVVLNAGVLIQCHSLEDGTFKSDHTVIGNGVTIGVEAFVHYGVTMGDGSVLEADAFLMKGESVAPFAVWQGNPATEVRVPARRPRLRWRRSRRLMSWRSRRRSCRFRWLRRSGSCTRPRPGSSVWSSSLRGGGPWPSPPRCGPRCGRRCRLRCGRRCGRRCRSSARCRRPPRRRG